MINLAEVLRTRKVAPGQLAIYWLCQAGFAFKTSGNQTILIDPYFSDVVERVVGFKRMMSCPIAVEEVSPDLIVCTHEHLDHMDIDALPILARNSSAHFAGPIECVREFERLGIPAERCHLLVNGQSYRHGQVVVHAVYADHGDLAPDALGIVLDLAGITVYHTGDTAYRPEEFKAALDFKPDILLPCINGAFGNMNARQAAQTVQLIAPRIVIPTHFWMFVEQNGNPAEFLCECAELATQSRAVLLKPGEEFVFERTGR